MAKKLLELPTDKLLEKLGAGSHKPGSGSASAFNGLIACQMITTVVQITLDPKRKERYGHHYPRLLKIKSDVVNRILPELEGLFQEDSDQFDKSIKKREERDKERNQKIKNKIDLEALKELQISTALPLEIATLCLELAEYATFLIDDGFQSARGDSCVALSSALSSVSGCLGIASLNLQSFPADSWTKSTSSRILAIKKEHDRLHIESTQKVESQADEANLKGEYLQRIQELSKTLYNKPTNTSKIEILARQVQNFLWEYKEIIWKKNTPKEEIEIIQPKRMIQLLKFSFKQLEDLGVGVVNSVASEVAGIINREDMTISISGKYKPEIQNFTSAHELGHALLHNLPVLHRDIPIDGSEDQKSRPKIEKDADKFAAFFLMPKTLVIKEFIKSFGTDQYQLNKESIFELTGLPITKFKSEYNTKRKISRLLATANSNNGSALVPMTKKFNVSTEAMAIRLEELELINY
jgi:Zn-dependent peptidase ImmA (M78 family)